MKKTFSTSTGNFKANFPPVGFAVPRPVGKTTLGTTKRPVKNSTKAKIDRKGFTTNKMKVNPKVKKGLK